MNFLRRIKSSSPPAFWLLVSVLICFLIFVAVSVQSYVKSIPLVKKQQELAKEFGVQLADYPHLFPATYFYTKLKTGMSVSEVHAIVREYEQVLHCGEHIEVYYYLTTDIHYTQRFYIFYDEQNTFARLQTEDSDSRRMLPSGCLLGPLKE